MGGPKGNMGDPLAAVLHSTPFRGQSGYRDTPRGSLWQVDLATETRQAGAHQVVVIKSVSKVGGAMALIGKHKLLHGFSMKIQ